MNKPQFINAEQTPQGAIILSTIHNGHREHKQYFSYSLRDAKREFKQYLKTR